MTDEAARFTAEQTVMDANLEVRELKHLLVVAEDKITKLEAENAELKKTIKPKIDWSKTPDISASVDYKKTNSVRDAYLHSSKQKEEKSLQQKAVEASVARSEIASEVNTNWTPDAPLRSVMSEKYAEPEDKSQLNADDEEPNKESF